MRPLPRGTGIFQVGKLSGKRYFDTRGQDSTDLEWRRVIFPINQVECNDNGFFYGQL